MTLKTAYPQQRSADEQAEVSADWRARWQILVGKLTLLHSKEERDALLADLPGDGLAVEPAAGIGQPHGRIHRLNPRAILGADALDVRIEIEGRQICDAHRRIRQNRTGQGHLDLNCIKS